MTQPPSASKRRVDVDGLTMAYVEIGDGDPIVFLHGNPTSSYLWRDVIPEVADLGRCLAPDLIGMGDSDKLADSGPDSYTYVEHRRYLDGWFEAVGAADNVTLVVHDWGSALGFDWASRHPDAIRGIAYMEAIVRPVSWQEWPAAAVDIFKAFRSGDGEDLVLDKNLFVEAVLPASVLTPLAPEDLDEYRRPFLEAGESRRPTLTWPRQVPIEGEPADVVAIVEGYGRWLSTSAVPKLFVNAEPGAILIGNQRDWCRTWPNQTEVTVPGIHFIQEDSGAEIGQALAASMRPLLKHCAMRPEREPRASRLTSPTVVLRERTSIARTTSHDQARHRRISADRRRMLPLRCLSSRAKQAAGSSS